MIAASKLEWLLARALREGIRRPFSGSMLRELYPALAFARSMIVVTAPSIETQLIAALKSEPDLRSFDGAMFCRGDGAARVELASLASWLLLRASTKGPRQAVGDLSRYLKLDHNPGYQVLAIGGIEVEQPVRLSTGISLIPFSRLPPSQVTHSLAPTAVLGVQYPFPVPGAALVKRKPTKAQVAPASSDSLPFDPTAQLALEEACLWLTIVGPSCPLPVALWWQLDSWVPFASHVGSSWSSSRGDIAYGRIRKLSAEDVREAQRVHAIATSIPSQRSERLRIPLQRLNQALRRQNPADRAIDLGIALESILITDSVRSELAFQFRLQGAWLVGSNPKKRHEVMELLRLIYECRSIAVHTGRLTKKLRGREPKDILDDGSALAVEIIKAVAERGILDWSEVVLGS